MKFRIEKPGFYLTREGELVEIVYQRERLWYGHWVYEDGRQRHAACVAFCCNFEGYISSSHRPMPCDVIAPADCEILVMAGGEFAEPLEQGSSIAGIIKK